jgi:hypothetical protein
LKKIALKYKGKADGQDKVIKPITIAPKVKTEDGTEEAWQISVAPSPCIASGAVMWLHIKAHYANTRYGACSLKSRLAGPDQKRVLTGVSFRVAERFSLSRFHKAVAQLAAPHPHC